MKNIAQTNSVRARISHSCCLIVSGFRMNGITTSCASVRAELKIRLSSVESISSTASRHIRPRTGPGSM